MEAASPEPAAGEQAAGADPDTQAAHLPPPDVRGQGELPGSAAAGRGTGGVASRFPDPFDVGQHAGLVRLAEEMERRVLPALAGIPTTTVLDLVKASLGPLAKWESLYTPSIQHQLLEVASATVPQLALLPDSSFPWLKDFDFTPAWKVALESAQATLVQTASDISWVSEIDLGRFDALLEVIDELEDDQVAPPEFVGTMIAGLEAELEDEALGELDPLPEDLETASSADSLTSVRALYRLLVLQRPDIRDSPRLHRTIRLAAAGSLPALLLYLWFVNPALFVTLMTVIGLAQTVSYGARAADLALAHGETPADTEESDPEDPAGGSVPPASAR